MRDDIGLFSRTLVLLPPIAAGAAAWFVYAKFHPFSFPSESGFAALCFALVVSSIFSVRLLLRPRDERESQSSWIAGIDSAVMPIVSLQVAIGSLFVGWLLGSFIALLDFWKAGASPIALIPPAVFAAGALVLGWFQTRPTPIQRIWRLGNVKNGLGKLEVIYEAARESNDMTILIAIAKMPRMHSALLVLLSRHADDEVRADVANNPNTPPAILEKLARDKAVDVRRAVAFNDAAGIDLLRVLARDADESIRTKAASRLRELEVTP